MRTHPRLLGEVELAESDSVFDEQCEVLCLDQQGLPVGEGKSGAGSAVLGPALGVGGDLPGHSAALHWAPALDLTGPVGLVEHHTLACFNALKTQDNLWA